MPKVEIEGLKGMRGLEALSEPEYRAWRNQQVQAGKLKDSSSWDYEDRLYRNQRFAKKYPELWGIGLTPAQRDQIWEEEFINEQFTNAFGNLPEFAQFSGLTSVGRKKLLSLGYASDDEVEKVANIARQNALDKLKVSAYSDALVTGTNPDEEYLEAKNKAIKKRNANYEEALAEDNRAKVANSKDLSDEIANNYYLQLADDQISNEDIESQFRTLMMGSEEAVETPFGDIKYTNPGSRHYRAFAGENPKEDSKVVKELTIDDKIKFLSDYQAVANKYGQESAALNLDTEFQDYLSDYQNWLGNIGRDLKQVVIGGVANIANKGLALYGIEQAIEGALREDVTYDEQLALFLQGLQYKRNPDGTIATDEQGNKLTESLPAWRNPKYWQGVEDFNTMSTKEIQKAEENGGISQYQNIYDAGAQPRFFSQQTADAAVQMGKFLWSDALTAYAMGGISRGVSGVFGAKFQNAVLNEALSSKMGIIANRVLSGTTVAGSAAGISFAYGNQTFNQTRQEGIEKADKWLEDQRNKTIESIISSPKAQQEIDKVVQQRMIEQEKRLAGKEDALRLSEDYIRQLTTQEYVETLKQNLPTEEAIQKQYNAMLKAADKAAIDAYIVDATIEEVRMSGVNALFRDYLFDKGTRAALKQTNPYLKVIEDAEGKLGIAGKVANKIKPITKATISGFTSNYFDDVTVGFGKGFGLGEYNNLIASQYDPENDAYTADFMSTMLAGINSATAGAEEALFDRQSFYDGWVGMIGSPIGITPRLSSFTKSGRGKSFMQDANGNQITFAEALNKYVNNSIISNLAQSTQSERALQESVDAANKLIAKKGTSFEDIASVVRDLRLKEKADSQSSALARKDAREQEAYNIAITLANASKDPILSQSTLIQEAQSTLQQLAEGTYDADATSSLIAQMIGQPDNKGMTKEEAAQRLQKNAKDFLNIQQKYTDINSRLNDSREGRKLNPIIRGQLVYQLTMDELWSDRLADIEKEISGISQIGTGYSAIAEHGSQRGYQINLKVAEESINELNKNVTAVSDALDRAKVDLKDPNISNDLRESQETLVLSLEAQLNALKAELQISQDRLSRYKEDAKYFVEDRPNVLSKVEILNLTPQQRADMLNTKNLNKYSIEQQAIIKETIADLKKKDMDIATKIADSKELANRVKANKESIDRISSNPKAAAGYLKALQQNQKRQFEKALVERIVDDKILDLESALIEDDLVDKLKTGKYTNFVLRRYLDIHPEKEYLVEPYQKIQVLLEDADDIIRVTDRPNEWKNATRKVIASVVPGASSVSEVMSSLEDLISAQTDPQLAADLNSIIEKIEQLGYQRDATKVRNREEEQRVKAQQAAQKAAIERAKDGKNFGWEGYKKGTTVYTLDSNGNVKEGYVKEFREGEEMVVHWKGDAKGTDYIYNAKTDKNKLSQSIPQTEAPNTYQQATKVDKDGKNLVSAEAVSANIPTVEQFTGDAEEVELTPEGMANSPSIEKQATQSDSIIIEVPKSDPTDGGNNIQVNTENSLLGHTFYIYDNGQLKNFGIEIRRTPGSENDTMSQFFRWIDENGIKLQEIIDYELGDIIANNPETKIQFLLSKPKGTKGEDAMQDIVLNVIEYTSEVAKYHKPERGGIIQANGKQWLVVGSLGFSAGSKEQQSSFAEIKYQLKVARKQHFDANPNEQYFVHPNYYTNIKEMASGRVVRQLTTDSEIQYRTISELLLETIRNPENLELEDLKWGIQQGNKFVTIGFTGEEKFYPPVDPEGTKGGVFLMTKAANDSYIPIAIRPVTLTQLRESALKDQIYDLINQVTAPKRSDRVEAIKQLVQMLNLDKKNNILIGDEKHNNITIVKNGVNIASFELGENFDRAGFISAINKADFRVNITTSVLGDPSKLKSYDEAGALITDAAKLGTSNAWYTVYQVDSTGKPIISQPIDAKSTRIRHNSELTRKSADSFLYKGKTYRLRDNIFYDELGKPIDINSSLYDSLYWNKLVRDGQLQPVLIAKDGTKYYIINNNPNNAKAIKITSDGVATEASPQQSLDLINKVTKQSQDASREQVAQQMLDRADYEQQLREQNKVELLSVEEIDDDIIAEQMAGNFTEQKPAQPIVQPIEERVPETTIKQDVNNAPTKSNLELQSSKTLTNFTELIRSREYRKILMNLAKEKGWNWGDTVESKEAFLKSKGISTTGITNINSWIDMIKNCK